MVEIHRPTPHDANLSTSANLAPKLDFGKFSEMPEYIAVNRSLVGTVVLRLPNNFIHVDVAAGTGMVEKLMKEEAEKLGKKGKVIGVDPNTTSLAIARRNVTSSANVEIKFIEGMGQNLKHLLNGEVSEGVDSTSIHDAIHEIWNNEDKADIIKSMAHILKPGGLLSFNSAFTTISNLNKDGGNWGRWKLLSMEKLAGGKVRRNKDAKAMPVLKPEEYKKMITDAGLVIVMEKRTDVALTKEALIAIARYPAFFEGTFADMPDQEKYSQIEKSNALVTVIEELGVPELTKVWYEVIAQKPIDPPAC